MTPITSAPDVATTTLAGLISSLADNKGSLGRRYGEWAVSAPTIESAVAAAAMAQDELGHARATYPVLHKLGVPRDEESAGGEPLPVLQQPLADWASFIASNLVIDGILTSFVATARDSSIEPLAQRARKILQEEGSHKVHAEAWAKRICRVGGSDLELLMRRVEEIWAQAARWPGPADHAGYAALLDEGVVSEGPEWIREAVRRWLLDLFAAGGQQLELALPSDWSTWQDDSRQ